MKTMSFKIKSLFIKEKDTYQNKLIKELNEEHQNLINIYFKITKDKHPKKKLKFLKKFYSNYHLHILKEDKQLYTYLLIKYKFIEDKYNLIKEKQKEMMQITAFIENFASKYSNVWAIQTEEFKKDLEILGEALSKRVEFEENILYSLY